MQDLAGQFVRVRLGNIDTLDLSLFEFDYDLTYTVFFLSADDKVYARYGQRNAKDADNLQSLKGLHYTMKSVLEMHQREKKEFAPRDQQGRVTIREIGGRSRGCYHCHNVKEVLNRGLREAGKWEADKAFRYPPPETLGMTLEVDRGNVLEKVFGDSAAAKLGLKKGDVLRQLDVVPIHSQADAVFALDRAPKKGELAATWLREGKTLTGRLALADGWRRNDVSWRPSLKALVPTVGIPGADLTPAEKKELGLDPKQLAYRPKAPVSGRAAEAGLRAGDVILGVEERAAQGGADGFRDFVRRNFLTGERITLTVLREGKRVTVPLTLARER